MSALAGFATALANGHIEIVDLTHVLSPDFPVIALPPEFGACQPVRIEEVSRYDARGPAWYWNTITVSEHAGTHFDAPAHWITGRALPNNTVDALPATRLAAPAVVIDVSALCPNDADFVLKRQHCLAHEEQYGRIPAGAWVLLRTDCDFWGIVPKGSAREEAIAAQLPVRRLGTVEDVARAVEFFADSDAGFVTGQVLFVCGGGSLGGLSL